MVGDAGASSDTNGRRRTRRGDQSPKVGAEAPDFELVRLDSLQTKGRDAPGHKRPEDGNGAEKQNPVKVKLSFKQKLLDLTPATYIGLAESLARQIDKTRS